MLKSIDTFLKELDEKNIKYCHWKSNEHIEESLNGETDLDILFDYSQKDIIEKVFNDCNLKRFRATPLMQYNGIEDFIGFDKDSAKIWHVHTHYKMTLGEKHLKGYTITPWSEIIINNRIRSSYGIYTSLPEDELVLLFCRIALKLRYRDYIKKVGNDDIKEINYLLKLINKEKLYTSACTFTDEKIADLIIELSNKNISKKIQFITLQKKLRKKLRIYTKYNKFTSYITRTKREIYWLIGGVKRRLGINNFEANRRVSPSGGCVVALLGCDGAGKSTTLKYIKKEFSKKIDVVNIYFGSGDGKSSLIRKPMKLIAKKVGGKGIGATIEKEYKENKKISFKSRVYSVAKIIWAISLAFEKKKKLKQMIKARNNGLLVITDRYPQSIHPGCSDGPLLTKYANSKGLLKKLSNWEFKIYNLSNMNPPDLTIKLMVPSDVAISRKPEMTIEEIETKKEIIQKLNISKKSVIIDTDCDFIQSAGEVMNEIWKII